MGYNLLPWHSWLCSKQDFVTPVYFYPEIKGFLNAQIKDKKVSSFTKLFKFYEIQNVAATLLQLEYLYILCVIEFSSFSVKR